MLDLNMIHGDLRRNMVGGTLEIVQRVRTRIRKQQGEFPYGPYYAGINWYNKGGYMGTKLLHDLQLTLTGVILGTIGVTDVLSLSAAFLTDRTVSINAVIRVNEEAIALNEVI